MGVTETRDIEMPYVNHKERREWDGRASLFREPCCPKGGLQTISSAWELARNVTECVVCLLFKVFNIL